MMEEEVLYELIPPFIKRVLVISNGWLVGSSPLKLSKGESVKDYDILVEDLNSLKNTLLFLSDCDLKINTFGGIKVKKGDLIVDLIPDTLTNWLTNSNKDEFIYKIFNNLIVKCDG